MSPTEATFTAGQFTLFQHNYLKYGNVALEKCQELFVCLFVCSTFAPRKVCKYSFCGVDFLSTCAVKNLEKYMRFTLACGNYAH